LMEVGRLRFGVAPAGVAFLDVLDHTLAHAEVSSQIKDGHTSGKVQSIALEGLGVDTPWVGKGDLCLANRTTGLASDTRDGEDKNCRTARNG
jgi:hypothetical protein